MFKNFRYILFLLILGCHKNEKSSIEAFLTKISNKPIVPNRISWDKIDSFANFSTFYLHNDSIYMFKSVNTCRNDSVIFAVENVEEFKGKYRLQDSILTFKLVRVSDTPVNIYSKYNVFDDTLRVSNIGDNYHLFYKKDQYRVTGKLFKETLNRFFSDDSAGP